MNRFHRLAIVLAGSLLIAANSSAQQDPAHSMSPGIGQDTRQEVVFPPLVKRQTLATMRMHLQGLGEIQQALADGHFEAAGHIATMNLGMSSMHGNQMAEDAKYMPKGMMQLGALMHQRAGEFTVTAQNAAVSGDIQQPLRALSLVTQTCVACHAAYRLR